MQTLPMYISVTFILTVILAVLIFSKAARYKKAVIFFVIGLAIIQSVAGLNGFYNDPLTATKRFPLLVFPSIALIVGLLVTNKGRSFIDSLDIRLLTLLHSVRILVELVLLWLFLQRAIPKAMTFEGRNFDIVSGLTAPLIWYFGLVKKKLSRGVLIAWNAICIVLLLNVVTTAIFSLPARFQQFGFEQPNIAVGYFPFLLLPAILVPMVLFANIAAIRQLIVKKEVFL